MARTRKEIVVLDGDLLSDCGIEAFKAELPERFIECGIAFAGTPEQCYNQICSFVDSIGGLGHLLLMGQGKADVGFTMADAGWDAYKGQGKFEGKQLNVRALMVLYPNRMHVVTVDGTGITKMSDLKGKRVSTGAPNSARKPSPRKRSTSVWPA